MIVPFRMILFAPVISLHGIVNTGVSEVTEKSMVLLVMTGASLVGDTSDFLHPIKQMTNSKSPIVLMVPRFKVII